jgi:hypothetical protein
VTVTRPCPCPCPSTPCSYMYPGLISSVVFMGATRVGSAGVFASSGSDPGDCRVQTSAWVKTPPRTLTPVPLLRWYQVLLISMAT